MPVCAVFGCNSHSRNRKRDKFKLFRFPVKNKVLLKHWVRACHRSDKLNLTNARVCSRHFKATDYTQEYNIKRELFNKFPDQRRSLKASAVPTLHLPKVENNSGVKADLYDKTNPDWAPSPKLGQIDQDGRTTKKRKERAQSQNLGLCPATCPPAKGHKSDNPRSPDIIPRVFSHTSTSTWKKGKQLKEYSKNYLRYTMMGRCIMLKADVIPNKFDFQKGKSMPVNANIAALQRKRLSQEFLAEKESNHIISDTWSLMDGVRDAHDGHPREDSVKHFGHLVSVEEPSAKNIRLQNVLTNSEIKVAEDVKQEDLEVQEEEGMGEKFETEEKLDIEIKDEKIEDEMKEFKEEELATIMKWSTEESEVPCYHELMEETGASRKNERRAYEKAVDRVEMKSAAVAVMACQETYQNVDEKTSDDSLSNVKTVSTKNEKCIPKNVSKMIDTINDVCHVKHEWLFNKIPEKEEEDHILFSIPVSSGKDSGYFNDAESDVCASETVFVDVEDLFTHTKDVYY